MNCTQNGSLYYSTPGSWWDIYTIKTNSEDEKIMEPPTEVPLPNQGFNLHPTWSPNGKFLAYVSGLSYVIGQEQKKSSRSLCIYSTETGLSKTINYPKDAIFPSWFPDSKSILVSGCDVIDISTEEITNTIQLKQHNKDEIRSINISSNGKYIYYVRENSELKLHAINRTDLETGKDKELYRTPDDCLTVALSPDDNPEFATVLKVVHALGLKLHAKAV